MSVNIIDFVASLTGQKVATIKFQYHVLSHLGLLKVFEDHTQHLH